MDRRRRETVGRVDRDKIVRNKYSWGTWYLPGGKHCVRMQDEVAPYLSNGSLIGTTLLHTHVRTQRSQ